MDWYDILRVSPFADEETVKKQYGKLALTLHPDKNESLRAEGAFKLVSEAWSLLSDKTKRLEYNQNRMKRKESSDGEAFEVDKVMALASQTIKHITEDDCADSGVSLMNVTSRFLAKVFEFCEKH
ncbi:hypothetical protein RYX36_016737 [Vicia faba]